MIFRESQDTTC